MVVVAGVIVTVCCGQAEGGPQRSAFRSAAWSCCMQTISNSDEGSHTELSALLISRCLCAGDKVYLFVEKNVNDQQCKLSCNSVQGHQDQVLESRPTA